MLKLFFMGGPNSWFYDEFPGAIPLVDERIYESSFVSFVLFIYL